MLLCLEQGEDEMAQIGHIGTVHQVAQRLITGHADLHFLQCPGQLLGQWAGPGLGGTGQRSLEPEPRLDTDRDLIDGVGQFVLNRHLALLRPVVEEQIGNEEAEGRHADPDQDANQGPVAGEVEEPSGESRRPEHELGCQHPLHGPPRRLTGQDDPPLQAAHPSDRGETHRLTGQSGHQRLDGTVSGGTAEDQLVEVGAPAAAQVVGSGDGSLAASGHRPPEEHEREPDHAGGNQHRKREIEGHETFL